MLWARFSQILSFSLLKKQRDREREAEHDNDCGEGDRVRGMREIVALSIADRLLIFRQGIVVCFSFGL